MFTCILCNNNSNCLDPNNLGSELQLNFNDFRYHLPIATGDSGYIDYIYFCNDCCNEINQIRTNYGLKSFKLRNIKQYKETE